MAHIVPSHFTSLEVLIDVVEHEEDTELQDSSLDTSYSIFVSIFLSIIWVMNNTGMERDFGYGRDVRILLMAILPVIDAATIAFCEIIKALATPFIIPLFSYCISRNKSSFLFTIWSAFYHFFNVNVIELCNLTWTLSFNQIRRWRNFIITIYTLQKSIITIWSTTQCFQAHIVHGGGCL
eukprot:Tbor_TRINITY_DN5470_c0_g1::TRINITY_DN5470_c0_g1_i10::g.24896::m.24896